jgi:hypothetical protein
MDQQAILTGQRLRSKPDLDWLAYENQSGEWSVFRCEAFEKHLIKLSQDFHRGATEGFWYGCPERRLLNG